MAAPATINIHNLNGTFIMNKKASDATTPMLKMQKIPWIVQQAANYSTVTVKLRQYKDAEGQEHLDQEQLSTGVTQTEERLINGEWGDREVLFWGKVKGWTKFQKVTELEDDYLKQGWNQETLDDVVVTGYVESVADTWTAVTVWGFADVGGERKHVRRVLGKKGKEELRIQLVYDYQPE